MEAKKGIEYPYALLLPLRSEGLALSPFEIYSTVFLGELEYWKGQ